ncbi:DUF1194 domain-containing protein [Rhizobium sp. ARZ01]|uniref:DUF1194 domain-containing protein n=1 Tax=Rhizobium sp. ARZ01 TaxID=2769313 RepID=UPI00177BA40E|nr:DUF1194 domain-containing protein [Rhizobium sp. ARZ01]MBD9373011.1 DUF1194 domain-containing protein [Rhizobium sp. ARZ01]
MLLAALAMLLSLTAIGEARNAAAESGAVVDLELVLAVDISGSMDLEEAQIQREGYVSALTHPEFLAAIREGFNGRIAISYFEWGGTIGQNSLMPWSLIATADDAARFAQLIKKRPFASLRGTSLSTAIAYGSKLFDSNGFSGVRRVIDISGDGPNNYGAPVVPARDAANALGIIVNGLAIMVRPSSAYGPLDRYYADCVIGGPGAFVVSVQEPEDFAMAIRRKLVLEVSGRQPPAHFVPVANGTDCMIGEKLRPGFERYPELNR